MRKFLSVSVNLAVAILTFVWFALPALTTSFASASGYDCINFEIGQFKYTLFALSAIVLFIASVVIAALSIMNLLYKLNVIKVRLNFANFIRVLLIIATICAIICFILNFTFLSKGIGIGACTILTLISYIVAFVVNIAVKEAE